MTLSAGNKALWSDITAIYTTLRNAQSKFGITQTTLPSNPGVMKPSTISNLKTAIVALSNSNYVSSSFVANTKAISIPAVGTLIKATPFSTMNTDVTNVFNVCAFDSSFNASCFGFSSDFCFSCSDCDFQSFSFIGSGFGDFSDNSFGSSNFSSGNSSHDGFGVTCFCFGN